MPQRRPSTIRRRVVTWIVVLAVGVLGFGVGRLWPTVVRPPLVLGQDAVSDPASRDARVTLEDDAGPTIVIRPAEGDGRMLFVLYPGGQVRPQAYEWLGRALAERDVTTVIPTFFADLAVTDINRADALIARYADGRPVVIGGHSLGGAMAADYAARHPDALAGLILMAAYPADNVTVAATWPAVSLRAANDEVADAEAVLNGLARLPAGSELVEVPGAVHSFFGRYGPQADDGVPTVSRAEAEAAIVAGIDAYLAEVS